jgi:hypothetical protein
MEGIPTGTVGNAGPSGLVGDFFHTERRSILSDEIGLTRVRRGLLLEEAIGYRWFLRKLSIFILVSFEELRSSSWPVLFCIVSVLISYL